MAKHRNFFYDHHRHHLSYQYQITILLLIANKFATTATQSEKWLTDIEKHINIKKSWNEQHQ